MRTVEQRFWEKVQKTSDCWIWRGSLSRTGYGCFRFGDKTVLAHRASYFLTHGSWPNRDVLHSCDNRSCVRPDHHFLGGQSENMKDAAQKRRLWQFSITHCPNGHEYTLENTIRRTSRKSRSCLTCSLERSKKIRDEENPNRIRRKRRNRINH